MKTFTSENKGKVHLIHLTEGDDLLNSLREAAKTLGIKTGIVTSGIGSLRKIVYHYTNATTEKPQDEFRTVTSVCELVSLQGIILESEPHLHALMSEGGTSCHSGHVEEGCEVQYLVELSVIEVEDFPVARRAVGEYGTVTHFQWLE